MKTKSIASVITLLFLIIVSRDSYSQHALLFGTVRSDGKISQARFETANFPNSITYAPYGMTPVAFKNIKQDKNQIVFSWQYRNNNYRCQLIKQDSTRYKGSCISSDAKVVELTVRHFTPDDASLQGNFIKAGTADIEIIERALLLLNNGKNWDRRHDSDCDSGTYPYQWSLFCALHQASIDVKGEYRHLRPAIQAVRRAIDEASGGKKYEYSMRDYNNEAHSFAEIENILNKAKGILEDQLLTLAGM